jgi:hypothetical protein
MGFLESLYKLVLLINLFDFLFFVNCVSGRKRKYGEFGFYLGFE